MTAKKAKNKRFALRRPPKFFLPLIVGLQFIVISALASYAFYIHEQIKPLESIQIASIISQAVDGLNQPVRADAQSGKLYIAPTHLTLPATTNARPLLEYQYTAANGDTLAELHIVSVANVAAAKAKLTSAPSVAAVFDGVPSLQACARGYRIFFTPKAPDGLEKVLQKQLSDGRTIYIYNEKTCLENNDSQDVMTTYLSQIDSYE